MSARTPNHPSLGCDCPTCNLEYDCDGDLTELALNPHTGQIITARLNDQPPFGALIQVWHPKADGTLHTFGPMRVSSYPAAAEIVRMMADHERDLSDIWLREEEA